MARPYRALSRDELAKRADAEQCNGLHLTGCTDPWWSGPLYDDDQKNNIKKYGERLFGR